jgi:hypothetical protein
MTLALHSFFEDMQPDLEIYKADADNETINGTGVDTLGYQGVVFFAVAGKGEIANVDLKVQQDSASNFGTAADLEGSKVTFATAVATNGFGFVEVKNPAERYVRAVIVAPNFVTARPITVIAIRYGKDLLPETNADGELHVSPAEGTA